MFRRRGGLAAPLTALAVLLLAGVAAAPASADSRWACRPDLASDVCRESLTTTILEPGGAARVVDAGPAISPEVDCFYVYPTISNQVGPNADRSLSPEIVAILRYQAQRFSQQCRVFAPLYRQITVPALLLQGLITTQQARDLAYNDVVDAWREYLRNDNRGRGVVLIGHSQGTGVLRRLIRNEIDPNPDVRKRLVSGVLLGGNVLVKKGSDIGGDFKNIRVCTRNAQVGCMMAFSSFWDPPASGARFGRAPAAPDKASGSPGGPDYEVACTNPASLAANARTPTETLIPTSPFPPIVGLTVFQTFGGAPPTAATPWLQPAERYSAQCERINGAHLLMIKGIGSAPKLNASPEPGWGLHIVDGNIALGDLQRRVAEQIAAYAKKPASKTPHISLRAAYKKGHDSRGRRCARTPLSVSLTGSDRRNLRRADFRVGKRLAKRDRRSPFAVKLGRRALGKGPVVRIAARAFLADGRTKRVSARVRVCG